MKQGCAVALALILLSLCATPALAKNPSKDASRFTDEKLTQIEENLVVGLTDENRPMLQASAAGVLREVKTLAPEYEFSSAVIPLMAIVKDEQRYEPARILAALALHDLNSERGNFAIKMTAKFTEQPRLKKLLDAISTEVR